MKVISHGRKLNKFGIPHERITALVENTGLLPLCNISYEVADRGLISAFVERWHAETNSFHLPIGEMSMTLDDVSNILHIPIAGQFCSYITIDSNTAITLLVNLLAVDFGDASAETRKCRGAHVRLSWLREVYEEACVHGRWDCAARAFLLHLVGCTIFADKSATSVSVSYLGLFEDLPMCGGYSWGSAALTHMYEQLSDASLA